MLTMSTKTELWTLSTKTPATPDIEIARNVDRFMRRIHAALNARAKDFDTHSVGPGGGILLLTLAEIEPARLQDLVRHMARDKSQMTRAINVLEAKGLVQRRDCPDDARVSIVALTAEGQKTVDELEQAVAGVIADILSPLSEDQKTVLKEVLGKI